MSIYSTRPASNKVYTPVFDETGAVEPLTLAELKAHLNITYSDDDTYLTMLITACRAGVEMFCNISIVQKECSIMIDAWCEMELPYGPAHDITTAGLKVSNTQIETGVVGTDYAVDGISGGFGLFIPIRGGRWSLVYDVGYETVPPDLKLDILRICGYVYENRGDQALTTLQGGFGRPVGLDQALELFAAKHRRLWV